MVVAPLSPTGSDLHVKSLRPIPDSTSTGAEQEQEDCWFSWFCCSERKPSKDESTSQRGTQQESGVRKIIKRLFGAKELGPRLSVAHHPPRSSAPSEVSNADDNNLTFDRGDNLANNLIPDRNAPMEEFEGRGSDAEEGEDEEDKLPAPISSGTTESPLKSSGSFRRRIQYASQPNASLQDHSHAHTQKTNDQLPTPPDESFESEEPSLEGELTPVDDQTAGQAFASYMNDNDGQQDESMNVTDVGYARAQKQTQGDAVTN